ncbi:heme-binding protein [Brenneria roseae subsp. roseae]|uniref:GlcG/HbpS family heme-binding protein n=1 Tax=Brenneria roseae TaxID=1509241 RepID=UPI000D618D3D|nr:heme-binding protein [Brenneria roseae]PWC17531.1 heme-binding protein [Brenneria roseae subsp. roseae]
MENLTFEEAHRAVNHALELAENRYNGRPLTVAVCDRSGTLLAFARMDGTKAFTVTLTQRKAYTAAQFGIPTAALLARLQKEQLELSYFADDGFSPLPGGIPVIRGNTVIGAVAVGGISITEDVEAAESIVDSLSS